MKIAKIFLVRTKIFTGIPRLPGFRFRQFLIYWGLQFYNAIFLPFSTTLFTGIPRLPGFRFRQFLIYWGLQFYAIFLPFSTTK
jgi:hypothetical protein